MSNEAQPGMAWRDIAASTYRSYAASTGNKNFRGDPMPAFGDLPRSIQVAWEAAVRQAAYCALASPTPIELHMSEQQWAGWVPPETAKV